MIFKKEDGEIFFLTVEYKAEPGYWGQVKGHVESGEIEPETAKREIYEETGLTDLTFINGFRTEIRYQPKPDVEKLVVFFLAQAHSDKVEYLWDEHINHRWLGYDDVIKQLTYDGDRDVVHKAAAFLID